MSDIIFGNLRKTYRSSRTVVFDQAPIEIEDGEIYIVAGRNGVGKSTLLRILSQIEENDSIPLTHSLKRSEVSYMPSNLIYYSYMKVKDLVLLHAALSTSFNKEYFMKTISDFGIDLSSKIISLSDGIKKVIGFILCLSYEAKLYVIDEPFPNVDLIFDEQFRKLIIERFVDGKTFIIATHQISEFEKVASQCIVIHDSKTIKIHHVDQIRREQKQSLEEFVKVSIR